MENDSNKIEGIMKDSFNKISTLLDRVSLDYKSSVIDPVTLEEIRKILKVYFYVNFKVYSEI